jgi:exopolysaccharide production protein ExoZ
MARWGGSPYIVVNMIARLTWIQLLRAIAALLVLIAHLGVIEAKYAIDPILPDWLSAGFAGVDLFFVISGFIMARLADDAARGPAAARTFILARAGRIYPLYWVITAVVTAMWLVRPDMVFASNATPDLVRSFLLLPADAPPILAVGWTLVHEMYFYVIFALLLLLPKRALLPALLIWGAFVVGGQIAHIGAASPEARVVFHPLTFEFIAGALAGFGYPRYASKWGNLALALGVSGMVMALGAVIATGLWSDSAFWTGSWLRPAIFAAPGALLVFGLAARDSIGRGAPPFLAHLGDQSYALYLTHVLSLSAMGRVWQAIAQFASPVDNVIALAALVLVAYLAAEIAFRLVDKPIHHVVRAFTKGFHPRQASGIADPQHRTGA